MQKLKIINSKGECIVFGMHSPYLLSHIEGLGIPQSDIYSTQSPAQDGSDIHESLLSERLITAKFTILCNSREKLYKEKRKLMSIVNPKLGKLTLIYTNDYKTYRIFAYLDGELDFKERLNHNGFVDISFICGNPFWLDEKDTEKELKYIKGGLSFPISFRTNFAQIGYSKTIINRGDTEIGCVIEYIGTAENPIITNETTGEYIKINRTLEEGQKLVINTADGEETVDIVSSDGTKINVFNWIDPLSTFFKLIQGENKITYSADNETAQDVVVNIIYSNKYVGV